MIAVFIAGIFVGVGLVALLRRLRGIRTLNLDFEFDV